MREEGPNNSGNVRHASRAGLTSSKRCLDPPPEERNETASTAPKGHVFTHIGHIYAAIRTATDSSLCRHARQENHYTAANAQT